MHTSNSSPAANADSIIAFLGGLKNMSTFSRNGFCLADPIGFWHEKCSRKPCNHRHLVASEATIRKNLFPPKLPLVLTKKGKANYQPCPHKDAPGHWYCAQVVHYGLQPTFHKATAKRRLAQALEAGTLDVPQHILDLRAGLRQQADHECDYHITVHRCAQRQERFNRLVEENKLQGVSDLSASFDPEGIYGVVSAPKLAQWGYDDLHLSLAMTGSELWGSFELGRWSGILKFEPRRPHKDSPICPTQWACTLRCSRRGNGAMFFGEEGEITIFPEFMDGTSKTVLITGSLKLQVEIKFAARRTSPLACPAASIDEWKKNWEKYNAELWGEISRMADVAEMVEEEEMHWIANHCGKLDN